MDKIKNILEERKEEIIAVGGIVIGSVVLFTGGRWLGRSEGAIAAIDTLGKYSLEVSKEVVESK